MKFFKFIAALVLVASSCFGLEKGEISASVTQKINQALALFEKKGISEDEKIVKFFAIFDPVFDYAQMAKISLGRNYNSLNKAQQDAFTAAFEANLKSSYIDKIKAYSGQKITIKGASEPQPNRYFVQGELTNDGKAYDFVYKFYDAKERGWLIYDIDIVGVSILQTYRGQFADIFARGGFEGLISKLKEQNAKAN